MLIMPIAIQMIENEEDRLFIERIYLQYEEDIFRVIRKYLGHSQDVEDVVNDVCVRMIAHIERLREIESENPKSYICKMARNATFDLLRKKRSEKAFMEREKAAHINQLRADIEGELDDIIRLADADSINKAMERISERDRDILRMKFWERLTDRQIAERIGVGERSGAEYVSHAKKNLARKLAQEV